MKEERRNYTLSNFTDNPLYETQEYGSNLDNIEEEEKTQDIKIDRNLLWNLEHKLSNILKRSIEIYKHNIINKKPFEKMKVLKFSELLRNSINDLVSVGVGMRDKDQEASGSSSFAQWDEYVESNFEFKINPSSLQREEKIEYLTDS